jgi:hypothetical protein
MFRSLAILAISLAACNAGLAQSNDDEIRLRATVQAIAPLTGFSGTITPVASDPKFALTVRIESAVPAVHNLAEGAVVTFAIHSPSLLFGGEPTKGKTYDFSLLRKIENGKVSFVVLRVVKPQSPFPDWEYVRRIPQSYRLLLTFGFLCYLIGQIVTWKMLAADRRVRGNAKTNDP